VAETDFERVTASDVRLMQELAQRVTATRPDLVSSDASFGELAWIWGHSRAAKGHAWGRRLWFDGDDLVAWAWCNLPHQLALSNGAVRDVHEAYLAYQAHPEHAKLVDEIIEWFDDAAPGVERTVRPGAADEYGLTRWAAHGYLPDPDNEGEKGLWTQLNVRDLAALEEPELPEGFRFRTADEVSPEDCVQAHVDAWHPSTFSAQSYADLQATATYRPDLHVLVEGPDGVMVASTIMWLDEANRAAEFEPVGTHRDFRRRGLGSALLWHGMHLARDAGATQMTVACLGAASRPAARGLYYGVGFRKFTQDVPLLKPAS
jgi:ribosomal protein S18 acetylase RimI-like enzyme